VENGMRSLSDLARRTLSFDGAPDAGNVSILEAEKRKAEIYNRTKGNLEGYDCKLCMNRGNRMEIVETGGGINERFYECRCMNVRRSILRMKQSGLENAIRECTFEKFRVDEEWQKRMLNAAKKYLDEGAGNGSWFYIGGAVGCGKTHICTAIARGLLYAGRPVVYMTWPAESAKLKATVTDEAEYGREIRRLKSADVLYIDDFFKPVGGGSPRDADVRLAYEIINHRYNARLTTLFSAERFLSELMDIDEATASRIYERAKGYNLSVARDRNRNQRLESEEGI